MREKSGVKIPTIWSRRWITVVVDTLESPSEAA